MFNKGEVIVCVINSRATLTVGKEYTVIDVWNDPDDGNYSDVTVNNDDNQSTTYDSFRFISKSDFREHKINELIK
jgi:hypothetical protein